MPGSKVKSLKLEVKNYLGFTLVEIIIAVTIVGLIGAASVPNLRRFDENQGLDNATSDVIQLLKKAQSNAMSGIKCDSFPTASWRVSFTSTATGNANASFQMFGNCVDIFGGTFPTPQPQPIKNYTPSTVRMCGNTCQVDGLGNKIDIKFIGSRAEFLCTNEATSVTTVPAGNFVTLQLKDGSGSCPTTPKIKVTSTGLILKE